MKTKKYYECTYEPGYLTKAGKERLESNIQLAYKGRYRKEITKLYFKDTYGLNIDFGQFFFKRIFNKVELSMAPLEEGKERKLVMSYTCTAKGKQQHERGDDDSCHLLSYDNRIIEQLFCRKEYGTQAIPEPSKSKEYEQYIHYEKKFSLTPYGVKYLHEITKGTSVFYDFSGLQNSRKQAAVEEAVVQVTKMLPQKFWFYDGVHSNLVSHYEIDGESYFFIFNSIKYSETPYIYERDDVKITSPNLDLMLTQVNKLKSLGKNIVINSEQRQNDTSNCHFFIQKDIETLESYPQLHQEILKSSEKVPVRNPLMDVMLEFTQSIGNYSQLRKEILEASIKDSRMNLFKFPAIMLKLTQSLSTLDEPRKNTVINVDEESKESTTLGQFIKNHCEETMYGTRNHHAQELQHYFLERCELLEFLEVNEGFTKTQISDLIGEISNLIGEYLQ